MTHQRFSDIITNQREENTVFERAPVPSRGVVSRPSFFKKKEERERTPRKRSKLLFVVGFLLVAVTVLLFSTLFEKTTLKITPMQDEKLLDSTFVAYPLSSATREPGMLFFDVLSITETQTKEVSATEVKHIDRPASGKVVIFNDFSSQTQRLIKNTRFETPEGLIYRIQESIVVPGQRKVEGKLIPGSIEVIVYADEAGVKHNIGLTDFTVPGFKGTPRFEKFYARSKTEMTGGFSGAVKAVPENILEETYGELRETLREKVYANVNVKKPDTSVVYPDGIFITYTDVPLSGDSSLKEEFVEIQETATLIAVMFNKYELGASVGAKILPKLGADTQVSIQNIDDLEISFEEKDFLALGEKEKITFRLKGSPRFVWRFAEDDLLRELAGKEKSELKNILAKFPSIVKAEVTLRPFWKRTFSENVLDIKLEKILDE